MAFKFLSPGSTGSSSSVKLFDIRLDNDYIVFRGGEDEAGSAQLAGQLALCIAEAMTITHVNLVLSGTVRMAYSTVSSSAISGRKTAYKEKTFLEKTWTFRDAGKGKTDTLQPGNYSWPFDTVLDGTLPESVEGLSTAYVVYRIKAEIGRKRAKDIVVRKPLRIVRTLGPSALELSHAMSVENIWPNKVEYSISTPSKAVVFGSFLQVDFKLIPLLKGLVIGNIATQLKEEQEFVVDPEWGISAVNNGCTKDERVIAYDNYSLDPEKDMQILEEAAEGFQFSRYLELPKSLTKCIQDCNVKGIKVRHKIKFNVQLHNPDGHVSELRANLPVSLYISENLPLNENNNLVDQTPQATRAALENDLSHSAPPLYGEHQLDQLYSDVDPSGYRTPGAALSNMGTPHSHSRNISTENLSSLDAVTNTPGHVSVSALQHRLQDLRASDRIIPTSARDYDHDVLQPLSGDLSRRGSQTQTTGSYFPQDGPLSSSYPQYSSYGHSGHSSQPNSEDISRRTSAEEHQPTSGTATPFFSTDHMEDLAKVPSYGTALKSPVPRSGIDLPSYGAATVPSETSVLTEPPSAHIRTSRQNSSAGIPQLSASDPAQRSYPTHRSLHQIQDDERRLRMMQARGRS